MLYQDEERTEPYSEVEFPGNARIGLVGGNKLVSGQVTQTLDRQEELLGHLSEQLTLLSERLQPVFDPTPEPETTSEAKPSLVPIANRIDSHNYRLEAAIKVVNILNQGVQL